MKILCVDGPLQGKLYEVPSLSSANFVVFADSGVGPLGTSFRTPDEIIYTVHSVGIFHHRISIATSGPGQPSDEDVLEFLLSEKAKAAMKL
jgi:hypothetical protein